MRILDLTPRFHLGRRLYAPHGSREEIEVKQAIRLLASERSTLPLPGDEVDLPTPYTTIWAHRLPVAQLVLTYTFTLPRISVHTLRPDLRAG